MHILCIFEKVVVTDQKVFLTIPISRILFLFLSSYLMYILCIRKAMVTDRDVYMAKALIESIDIAAKKYPAGAFIFLCIDIHVHRYMCI